ncbi:MAG: hypothetical protein EA377_06445 [Phycisphaerales bacterium]|nr:MAG: hypothetical protein EA377_06445 [Phycisphaerales bacterium]
MSQHRIEFGVSFVRRFGRDEIAFLQSRSELIHVITIAAQVEGIDGLSRVLWLFGLITLLLLLIFLMITVIAVLRHRRRIRSQKLRKRPEPNAWEEAGRRTEPYEPRPKNID